MKKLIILAAVWLMFVPLRTTFAQESGALWIKTFNPGSADLNDSNIEKEALAELDKLMQDPTIEVTFLGAADSIGWFLEGRKINDKIAEAWNDAKRLSRARALRARYGRGNVGITHDSVAGVKVIWTRTSDAEKYTKQLELLQRELTDVKNNIESLKPEASNSHTGNASNGHGSNGKGSKYTIKDGLTFNWRLQAGLWTWQSGSDGSLLSPSLALNIVVNKTAFVLQGGVSLWQESTALGNTSESFVYTGIKYMKSDRLGFTAGAFRGWEFFTSTDNWLFKTTGIATGIVFKYGKFEVNPTLSISNINTLENAGQWRVGSTVGLNFNIN